MIASCDVTKGTNISPTQWQWPLQPSSPLVARGWFQWVALNRGLNVLFLGANKLGKGGCRFNSLKKMQLLYLFVFTCCCDSVLWRFWVVTHVVDTNVWCFLEIMWRISHDGHRPDLLLLLLLLENVHFYSWSVTEVQLRPVWGSQRQHQRESKVLWTIYVSTSVGGAMRPLWAWVCWSQPSLFRLRLKQMLTRFSFLQLLNSLLS